jgi:hypothetical protein
MALYTDAFGDTGVVVGKNFRCSVSVKSSYFSLLISSLAGIAEFVKLVT